MAVIVKCNPKTNIVDWVEQLLAFAGSGTYSKRDENTLVYNVSAFHAGLCCQLAESAAKAYSDELKKQNPNMRKMRVSSLIKCVLE